MQDSDKKRCHAHVEKTNSQCTKNALPNSIYCYVHYPRKLLASTLFSLLGSAILGGFIALLITIFAHDPIFEFLSHYLHHLDKTAPLVVSVNPDITTAKIIDKNNKIFELSIRDDESGIELDSCAMTIYYKKQDQMLPIPGETSKTQNRIVFTSPTDLQYGQYVFECLVSDKARNKERISEPFIVIQQQPLLISGYIQKYEESLKKDIFATFIGKRDSIVFCKVPDDFWIYILKVANRSEQLILRDLDFSLDAGMPIFDCTDFWTDKVEGIKHYSLPEADKRYWKGSGRVYISRRFFSISEIKPHGMVQFALLLGSSVRTRKREYKNGEIRFNIVGSYFWDGFGFNEKRQIDGIELSAEL